MPYYDFNNNPSNLKQEELIMSIIEGRLIPKDLSSLPDLQEISSTSFIYVDDNGTPTKLTLTDLTNGVLTVVSELPSTANEGQLVILNTAEGYIVYKYEGEEWHELQLASNADIVAYNAEESSLTAETVQGAIDELSEKVDHMESTSVYSINEQAGDVVIEGTEDKLAVSAAEGKITLDASALALNADLETEIQRATQAEADAEQHAKDYATEYTNQEVGALSNDVYHKADIKAVALTGEAEDVHVQDIVGISSNNLQIVLGLLNQKATTGGIALEIQKLATPTEGYLSTYQLFINTNESSDGVIPVDIPIDIPKDYVLKSGLVKECEVTDEPLTGLQVGDPYLQLNIGTQDNSVELSPLYISLVDLIDIYVPQEEAAKIQLAIELDSAGQHVISADVVTGSIERTDLTTAVQTELNQIETNREAIIALDAAKVDKVDGYRLMSDSEGNKLEGIEAGAEVNVQADWLESDGLADSYIQNKPELAAVALSGSYADLINVPVAGEGIQIVINSDGIPEIENTNLSAEWGNIEGILSDQTDLQDALDLKVDKNGTDSLMTAEEHAKLGDIQPGAEVNYIKGVSEQFEVSNIGTLQLNRVSVDRIVDTTASPEKSLRTLLNEKVDKQSGKTLIEAEKITKLDGIAAEATKVAVPTGTNGLISINGSQKVVYTLPSDVVKDDEYSHITVTNTSVSDGTTTFNQYNDTALANRVTTLETSIAGKQDILSESQLAAADSGVTTNKVTTYDNHVANTDIHVTAAQKAEWSSFGEGKQNAINAEHPLEVFDSEGNKVIDGLSEVATSGSYADLTDKPTIPTVNDGSLTIQKNGTTIDTFTANDVNDVVVNVEVPTAVSQLSGIENYATTSAVNQKLNQAVVTGFSSSDSAAGITLTATTTNLSTGSAGTSFSVALPVANSGANGLMSSTAVVDISTAKASIDDLQTQIDLLQGSTVNLLYKIKANPTATEINAFVKSEGYQVSQFGGITVIVQATGEAWKYYLSESEKDSDGDPIETPSAWKTFDTTVAPFTATTAGLIESVTDNTKDGQIQAVPNEPGHGQVIGWGDLKARINNVETNGGAWDDNTSIKAQLSTVTASVTSLASTKQDILVSGTDIKTLNVGSSTGISLLGSGSVSITKAELGLNNVVNTGDSATPVSGGTTKFTTGGAFTELNKKQNNLSKTDFKQLKFETGTYVGSQWQSSSAWYYPIWGSAASSSGGTASQGTAGNIPVGTVYAFKLAAGSCISLNADATITSSGYRLISHTSIGSSGTYGTMASATITPAFGESFSVPAFVTDAYGHISEAGVHLVSLPSLTTTTYSFSAATVASQNLPANVPGNALRITTNNGTTTETKDYYISPNIASNITGTGNRTSGQLVMFDSTAAGSSVNTVTEFPLPSTDASTKFLNGNLAWEPIVTVTNETNGLMLSTDKAKLDATLTSTYQAKLNQVEAPTTAGGTTYSTGSAGYVLKAQGEGGGVYWAQDADTTYTAGAGITINSNNVVSLGYSTATLASGSWTGSAAPYTQAITVTGVTADDHPIIDLNLSSGATAAAVQSATTAWMYVCGASTTANTITFYAASKPTVALPIQILGF